MTKYVILVLADVYDDLVPKNRCKTTYVEKAVISELEGSIVQLFNITKVSAWKV